MNHKELVFVDSYMETLVFNSALYGEKVYTFRSGLDDNNYQYDFTTFEIYDGATKITPYTGYITHSTFKIKANAVNNFDITFEVEKAYKLPYGNMDYIMYLCHYINEDDLDYYCYILWADARWENCAHDDANDLCRRYVRPVGRRYVCCYRRRFELCNSDDAVHYSDHVRYVLQEATACG